MHHRERERVGDVHVGELVLHRLERADRLAELLTLVRIAHGHVEHRLSETDQLCRDRNTGEVEGRGAGCTIEYVANRRRGHLSESDAGVDRRLWDDVGAVASNGA